MQQDNTVTTNIQGTVKAGKAVYEYIYWKWVFTLDSSLFFDETDKVWVANNQTRFNELGYASQVDAFDAFDSEIGFGDQDESKQYAYTNYINETQYQTINAEKNDQGEIVTTAYQQAMTLKLSVDGAQAKPVKDAYSNDGENGTTTTIYKTPTTTTTASP